jgi:phage baseplate assembly protein V
MSIDQIRAAIDKALARVRQPFRGTITHNNNTPDNQMVQVTGLAGESLPDVELMQQYGFSSNPPAGTPAIIIPLGGKTAHGIIIATEGGAARIKPLAEGEAVIYNARGDYIVLRHDGLAEIHCRQLQITAPDGVSIDAPNVDITGNLKAAEVMDQHGGKSMSGMRGVFNLHTHKQNGSGPPNQNQ